MIKNYGTAVLPAPGFQTESTPGDGQMNVGVPVQFPAISMQGAEQANIDVFVFSQRL